MSIGTRKYPEKLVILPAFNTSRLNERHPAGYFGGCFVPENPGVTLLQKRPAAARGKRMPGRDGSPDTIELIVPCKPEYVRSVRVLAGDIAASLPMSPASIGELKVAVSEAVSNAMRHAYRGHQSAQPVAVLIQRTSDEITVEIVDHGVGFDPPPQHRKWTLDPNREGGLGIILIRELMDHVDYWSQPGQGTRIRMSKLADRLSERTASPSTGS
jgi:serine/threonine-protein kinase RsbW